MNDSAKWLRELTPFLWGQRDREKMGAVANELDALTDELLDARCKLALAAEDTAGLEELINIQNYALAKGAQG